MLREEKLPRIDEGGFVSGDNNVRKITIEGLNEMQSLTIERKTNIEKHGHGEQWEIWLDLKEGIAYICGKGKKHQILNLSKTDKKLMAIKGDSDIPESDLAQFFKSFEMQVIIF
ncbi:MAG: hypothetical protein HFJ59_04575 [Clostridia bacterium]|nr:hypothetical protein [Clostridia bacterium]